MPWAAALARGRIGRLLTSSSLAALLIGGGVPAALACTINANSGGTIPPVTNSSAIDCIVISNGTTVTGDVTNAPSGHITATGATRPTATGITVTNASVTGAVSNQGTITASTGAGIRIDNGGLVSGGIGNSGTIAASVNAIRVGGTATGTGTFTISTFAGGISNSGTLSAAGDAISVSVNTTGSAATATFSTFSGGITNSGTITAAGAGIKIVSNAFPTKFVLFAGDISNGGAVSASRSAISVQSLSTFAGGIVNSGALTSINAAGIKVVGIASFTGSISNGGTITSSRDGVHVTGLGIFGSSNSGGIVNSGTIAVSGSNSGILAAGMAELFGGISNAGTISARVGINTQGVRTFAGGIANSGGISAAGEGIFVGSITTFLGGISNGGTITAGVNGIDVQNLRQSMAGGITNSGSIRANASGILFLNSSNFSGGISNAGTLSAGQNGIWAAAISSGVGAQMTATFAGGIANSGTISAGGNAIWLEARAGGAATVTLSAFSGGISNGGSIMAAGNAIRVGATATGTATATISTFAGGISNSGTLSAGGDAIVVAGGATGSATAIISTFAGGIANSGTIVGHTGIVVGAGVSMFAGVVSNSGIITGTGGTAIDLALGPANMTVDITGGAINGNMLGAGLASGDSIHFALGSGTFVYAAPYGFSGFQSVTVDSGTVLLNGTNVAAAIDVLGGTLGGTGTLDAAAVTVHAGGAFAPGMPGVPGTTMTIAGNLAFQPGAAYVIYLNPTTSTSASVTGTATLAGTVNANFGPGAYQSKTYDILHSAGLNGTTFNGLITSGLFNFNASLSYTSTDVLLTLSAALGAGTSLGQNQQNVASAIDNVVNGGVALPPGFANLFNLSGANLANALTALDGENATGAQRGAFGLMTQFLQLMLYPDVDGRGAGDAGGPLGFAPDQPAGLPPAIAHAYDGVLKAPPQATFDQRWRAWGTAFGGTNRANGDPVVGSTTVTASSYGLAAGVDYRASRDTVLGFALAGGGTSWGLTQGLGTGRSDALMAGLYGATHLGPAYVAGSLGYANHWFTTSRTGFAADQLSASFGGQSLGARLEGGYRIPVAVGRALVGVTPYAAAQAQWFRTPAYTETDLTAGGFGLSYAAMAAHDTRGELGTRLDALTALGGMPLILRGRVAWAHDWVSNPALTAVFQALPAASFTVNGAPIAKNSALTTASAELRLSPGWGLGAKFDGEFAGGAQTYAGTGTLRYSW